MDPRSGAAPKLSATVLPKINPILLDVTNKSFGDRKAMLSCCTADRVSLLPEIKKKSNYIGVMTPTRRSVVLSNGVLKPGTSIWRTNLLQTLYSDRPQYTVSSCDTLRENENTLLRHTLNNTPHTPKKTQLPIT